jgi:hypothetical protein
MQQSLSTGTYLFEFESIVLPHLANLVVGLSDLLWTIEVVVVDCFEQPVLLNLFVRPKTTSANCEGSDLL